MSKKVVNEANLFGSDQIHEFCIMCWKHRDALEKDDTERPTIFHIGPDKLTIQGKDKIMIECRKRPEATDVSNEGKEYLMKARKTEKTVFELRPGDASGEKVFIRTAHGDNLFKDIS